MEALRERLCSETLRRQLQDVLRRREARYLELLREMVAINSFTRNRAGIEALSRRTAEAFHELGLSSESVPAEDRRYGPHLALVKDAGPAAPQIALVSHLDTVFPPEEERRHDFVWREEGDRLYGPGTVDIKGGTVLIYMMLDALRSVAPEVYDSVSWAVFLNSAEEQGSMDFDDVCLDRLDVERTRACLVFEGGLMKQDQAWAVVARKGMAIFLVEVEGRAAHAGTGHGKGANALLQMADVIRRIESWTDYAEELTFNVGVVHGGTVTNRVPHAATAQVEMRAFRSDVFDRGLEKMMNLSDLSTVASASDGHRCRVRVEVIRTRGPWSRNPASDRLLEIWQEAGKPLGIRVEPEERGGLSDGNLLWQHLPTLDGMGPSGANAHCSEQSADGSKEQEYATRSSFVPKALLNTTALLRLLDQD